MNKYYLLLILMVSCGGHVQMSPEELVSKVLKDAPLIDGHNDLLIHYIWCRECPRELDAYPLDTITTGHIDIPRLRKGGVGALLTNIFGRGRQMHEYLQGWDLIYRIEEKYPHDFQIAVTTSEVRKVMKDGMPYVIEGIEDASTFPNILLELANRGWTESELKKVTQQNFLRIFEAVELKAAELQKTEQPRIAKVSPG